MWHRENLLSRSSATRVSFHSDPLWDGRKAGLPEMIMHGSNSGRIPLNGSEDVRLRKPPEGKMAAGLVSNTH